MFNANRDGLDRNSDKAGLRRHNGKDAAMPELIGSSDKLWEYLKRDRAGRPATRLLSAVRETSTGPRLRWLTRPLCRISKKS
jgi:hypothetical protein